MYNLIKTLHFFWGKKLKKKLGLSRLLYLDYDYFRNLIIRLRLLQKSDFARILDYDYFRNLISLDSSITITSENYVVLDYSITITSENYVALDYSITITSKKSSQPIWPSLQKTMPLFQIKFDGGVWLKYFQTVLSKKIYGPYL